MLVMVSWIGPYYVLSVGEIRLGHLETAKFKHTIISLITFRNNNLTTHMDTPSSGVY